MCEGTICVESRVHKNQNHSPFHCRVARCADSVDPTQKIWAESTETGSRMLDRISRSKGSIRFEINRQINATTRQTPSADAVDQQNKVITAESTENQTFTARNEQKVSNVFVDYESLLSISC